MKSTPLLLCRSSSHAGRTRGVVRFHEHAELSAAPNRPKQTAPLDRIQQRQTAPLLLVREHLHRTDQRPGLRGHEGAQQAARASDGRRREFGEYRVSSRYRASPASSAQRGRTRSRPRPCFRRRDAYRLLSPEPFVPYATRRGLTVGRFRISGKGSVRPRRAGPLLVGDSESARRRARRPLRTSAMSPKRSASSRRQS